MSKKETLINRLNLGFSLAIVFLLVLATNRIDKKHFDTVQSTISTIYKDRVVAQDLIYKMNNIIHEKKLQFSNSNSYENHESQNKEFTTLIDLFSSTKLTPNEEKTFENLVRNFDSLINKEIEYSSKGENPQSIISILNSIKIDLNNLSSIQISESKYLTGLAQKSLDTNNIMSNLEIAFLLIIGIIMQFAVFHRVKKSKSVDLNV